ncbi:unnamed protein product [Rotaria sordida]|uniref:U3 small nucleolar RNA-associated protein 14 homolog A n=1 Tax=Rotaria sordida TaxID=392033 RepID=A0A814WVL7_9BILA|nr:unnamed protein product [Rotaria sordida]CAF1206114.1 unnamed protein product [Rotaria sordida]
MENDFIEEPTLIDDDDAEEEQSHSQIKKHKHDKLIDSIVHLDGKKRKVTIRKEPISIPNNLIVSTQTSTSSKKIKSHQLLSSLKKTSSLQIQTLKKQLAKVNKHQAVLQQPLQKPQAEKAERIAAYNQEKKSLKKWDPIVEKNRTAETLNFPLQNGGVQFQTTEEFVGKFQTLSSLEKDIAAILQSSNNNIQPNSLLTQAEKKIISKMDLLEAKQKLNELKRMRALISYQQAKFKRVRKIKSKKFRRLVRKDRQKQEEKNLEKLSIEHPDQFLERLEQLERRRIEERSTLRHKNSTKWAKEKRLLSKFNTKVREDIEEQLKLGKQLSTKKAQAESDDDDDDDDDDEQSSSKPIVEISKKKSIDIPLILAPSQTESEVNPWLTTSPVLPSSEYSKLVEVQNEDTSSSSSSDSDEQDEKENQTQNESSENNTSYGITTSKPSEHLNMPDNTKRIEIESKQTEQHQMNIQEAFADDDVLAEFEKEKAEIIDRDRPKSIDLSLPGWGEWAGSGVSVNKRKKRKFLIHPKPAPPRRDVHLHHVIINEKTDEKISEHRVSDLPFPFANVEQFESVIQQPLGREWNPETAFRRLNQPKIRSRIGVRIEPLNKQDIFLKHHHSKQDNNSLFDFNLTNNDQEKSSSNIEHNSLFDNNQSQKKKFKKKKKTKLNE